MKKKEGKSYTLYLPDHLMAKVRMMADANERSTSFVVACALKQYFSMMQKSNAPLAGTGEALNIPQLV